MFRKKSQVFIPVFIVLESFSHKLLKEKSGNQAKSYWILTRVDSVLRLVLMGLNWARATLVCIANPSKASSFFHSCVSRLYNNTHTHTHNPKCLVVAIRIEHTKIGFVTDQTSNTKQLDEKSPAAFRPSSITLKS